MRKEVSPQRPARQKAHNPHSRSPHARQENAARKINVEPQAADHLDDTQTDQLSDMRQWTNPSPCSPMSRLSRDPGSPDSPKDAVSNQALANQITPKVSSTFSAVTSPQQQRRQRYVHMGANTSSKVAVKQKIKIKDYSKAKNQDLAVEPSQNENILTVRGDSRIQITSDADLHIVDPRTAASTRHDRSKNVSMRDRYPPKMTLPKTSTRINSQYEPVAASPTGSSKISNEDLILPFSLPITTAGSAVANTASGEITVIHEMTSNDATSERYSQKSFRTKHTQKKTMSSRRRDEHLISPFETESSHRGNTIHMQDHKDTFSISGEFSHHQELEHQQQNFELQKISHLDSLARKQEGQGPQWPADLNRAQDLVMTNRVPSSQPPKVVGLPDIKVQGSEPRMLNLSINPQTAREMSHHALLKDIQDERDRQFKLEAPIERNKKRKRSKSKRKKKLMALSDYKYEEKTQSEIDREQDRSYIQGVLGKYIYDYDEHKRRQNRHMMSQSIDVHDLNQDLRLPMLDISTIEMPPRKPLRSRLPTFVEQAKRATKPFAPTPRITQSVDFDKFKSAVFEKHRIEDKMLALERQDINDINYFAKAIKLDQQQRKIDAKDSKIFLQKDFISTISNMTQGQNEAISDFNQYFNMMTDKDKSPFVPSHIAKARRIKEKQQNELAEQEKIKEKWEVSQAERAHRHTNELLTYSFPASDSSLDGDQHGSLEKRISVGDLKSVGDMTPNAGNIRNISQKELDIDLGDFRRTLADKMGGQVSYQVAPSMGTKTNKEKDNQTKEKKDKEQDHSVKLDERYFEARKALEAGDLTKYQQLQNQIQRFPAGLISPNATPQLLKFDEQEKNDMGSAVIDPKTFGEKLKNTIDKSLAMHEDPEIQDMIKEIMAEILEHRIADKTEKFEQNVFGQSMQVIKQMNQRLEKATLETLNELIDEYMVADEIDMSPLLQVFDKLTKDTKVKLPSKSLLQQDQKFFQKALRKQKQAHKIELRWVKTESLRCAREYVNKKNYEIQQIITKQICTMYRQYNEVRDKAVFFKNETERLTEKLVGSDARIAELANYVRAFNSRQISDENVIKFIDENETACESSLKKDRLVNLDQLQQMVKRDESLLNLGLKSLDQSPSMTSLATVRSLVDCDCKMRNFARLQNKYLEKLSNFQDDARKKQQVHWSKDGIILPSIPKQTSVAPSIMRLLNQPQTNSQERLSKISSIRQQQSPQQINKMKIQEFDTNSSQGNSRLNLLSPAQNRELSIQQYSVRDNSRLSNVSELSDAPPKTLLEEINQHAQQNIVDPLLQKQFGFYNTHVVTNAEDRVGILKNNVVNYYQGRQVQMEEYLGLLEAEIDFFKRRNAKLQGKNICLSEKIKELNQRIKYHFVNFEKEKLASIQKQRAKFRELEKQSAKTLQECKQIFTAEIHVQEQIVKKALADNVEKTNLLRQFAFILKTPRIHHEYIERYGVDPFIEKFTQIISENKALKDEMVRLGEDRRVRKAISLVKHKERQENHTVFTKSLPMQIELLIKQRSKFLGKALEEVRIDAKQFKPELEKQLQAQRRRQAVTKLSRSVSVDPSRYQIDSLYRDEFDTSQLGTNESVFSTSRVNLAVPAIRQPAPQVDEVDQSKPAHQEPTYELHKNLSVPFGMAMRQGSLTQRNLTQHMSQEFTLQQTKTGFKDQSQKTSEAADTVSKGAITRSNLKDIINDTIRNRSDFEQHDLPARRTNHNSQTICNEKSNSGQGTQLQSKTILHQAYMQALSQSSSMQEIVKQDYEPGNILARSDANLARTRQQFLDQYEMVNQYTAAKQVPSYKFALSSSLIDSVQTVMANQSKSKDYKKHVQSQIQVLDDASGPTQPTQTLNKHKIIPEDSKQNLSSFDSLGPSPQIINERKRQNLMKSYDNQRPFHKQMGMRDWGEK